MAIYHQRRPEKAITQRHELDGIIRSQKTMTLAMCNNNEPYLTTVNYGYDEPEQCFYFHCAPAGKKVDFLKANPQVWGQIVDDQGYLDGQCNHAYRSIQFSGQAELLDDAQERQRAMDLMVDQLESDPVTMKQRLAGPGVLEKAALFRIRIGAMTGKRNPAE